MTNRITHNGKQYEVGKWYEYKGDHYKLVRYRQGREHPFVIVSEGVESTCSYLIPIDLNAIGAITDAPIELEEGCWYMTHANKPVYWDGQHWNITATGGNSGRYDSNRFTPLYKMERAK